MVVAAVLSCKTTLLQTSFLALVWSFQLCGWKEAYSTEEQPLIYLITYLLASFLTYFRQGPETS